jgi:hypothetical protein
MSTPPIAHQQASKLAQLLGEVIVHHAPWTAQINEAERRRQTELFLEGLEAHTAEKVGPVLTELFDGIEVPEVLQPILADAIGPQAQFSAIVTQIVLYGVVSQLLGSSMQPFIQGITNDLWAKAVGLGISVPVSPAVLATAAGRGLKLGDPPTTSVPAESYAEAAKSGVSADALNLQASLVGLPPALQELFELLRRGDITEAEVRQGLREGDFRDDWIDRALGLAYGWLTPIDFVDAAVQEQMSYGDAREWATKTGLKTDTPLPIDADQVGGSNDMFGLAWSTRGRPPGPVQLAEMTLRGIIPRDGTGAGATTFQQGIAESDVKTKWTDALYQLAEYIPPAASIGVLLEHGAITREQAVALWEKRGVPSELASGYAYMAEQQHIGQDKLLARGDILKAYFEGLMDRKDALEDLDLLGYRDGVATELLDLQDFRREFAAIGAVARKIEAMYSTFRISPARAKEALTTVGIPAGQADSILKRWDVIRVEPLRVPTTREIGMAAKAGTITVKEGLAELAQLGYQPRDAAIVLSAHLGKPITPLPAAGTTVTG